MLRKMLTLIAVLASSIGFAQDAKENPIINEILANEENCVVGCSEDRIYLNPSRIHLTEQGLYLNLNDADYVLLPTLNSDNNGCYVSDNRVQAKKWQCPYCHYWWDYGKKCTNPDCPTMQWKKE